MTIDQVNKIKTYIKDVSFKVISDEEVHRLSVLQVTNPKSFDDAGLPAENGVYDLRLGPSKRDSNCGTCKLNAMDCEGHYAHIKLPLPVINPFLFKLAYQILEMTCVSCYRLLIKPIEKNVFDLKLKLLENGLDYLLNTVKDLSNDLINDSFMGISEKEKIFAQRIEEAGIFDLLNKKESEVEKLKKNNRNSIEEKNIIVKEFFQRRSISFLKCCSYCQAKRQRYSLLNLAILMSYKDKHEKTSTDELFLDKITENLDSGKKLIHPLLLKTIFRKLWEKEKDFLVKLIQFSDNVLIDDEFFEKIEELDFTKNNVLDYKQELYGNKCLLDLFFNEFILVSPIRFRPLKFMDDRQFESPKSTRLNNIIHLSNQLSKLYNVLVNTEELTEEINIDLSRRKKIRKSDADSKQQKSVKRDAAVRSFYKIWNDLQEEVSFLFDQDMVKTNDKKKIPGFKQLIEKKEGLFRKNIMGKRVNYAARSVISPDPYIMVDEIGFPEIFAKKLTFPEPVNDHNYEELKNLVLNGPDIYPGAVSVQMENGNTVRLNPNDGNHREAIAFQVTCNAYSKANPDLKVKVVNRHLRTGDILLLNRQPTLHKPSIMAHKARVLPGEKTLRLHYANCKCYNADFDGDEMNAHFPQSFLTRAEGYNIVSVNYQYLVPKDGTPLSGLIQDHIVSATMLTYRGEFFTKSDYQNLVYGAICFLKKPIKFLGPSILKPHMLWSGKQVVSTIILNLIPEGKSPPYLNIASKIKQSILISQEPREFTAGGKIKPTELCESQVVIRAGELLVGLFDKSNLGNTSYGLIHTCYELYGGEVSSSLLTAFARLANNYLQSKCGFTLGIYDILITKKADKVRKKLIKKSTKVGDEAVAKAFNVLDTADKESLLNELQDAHTSSNPVFLKMLDSSFKSKNDETSNNISKECLPAGLLKPFPYNHLQMMIQPGAKGGLVNALQISCLLGQIELEGKRVPLMISGKTLPSFEPYDTSPKAGGFVTGRFLTGICPQEFFFHCMAGREGLIDTAVKTSRSGYLQRCLIKHLEGLVVNYDNTVRDSDQSIIQFLYGEDGLDILKSQLLKEKGFSIISKNIDCLAPQKELVNKIKSFADTETISMQTEDLKDWDQVHEMNRLSRKRGTAFPKFFSKYFDEIKNSSQVSEKDIQICSKEIINSWYNLPKEDRKELNKLCANCPDPVCFKVNPSRNYNVLSEKMDELIENYIQKNPDRNISKSKLDSLKSENLLSKSKFSRTVNTHYMKSLCEPGEAVGLLAAQSIGEPSTQMTLNTFHFAGRGEMNVTLGIPRLREILMTASPNISTPSMDIPFRDDLDSDEIEKIANKVRIQLTCCNLSDVLEYVEVTDKFVINQKKCSNIIQIKFKFLRQKYFKKKYSVTLAKVLEYFETTFVKNFVKSVKRKIEQQSAFKILVDVKAQNRDKNKDNDVYEDKVTELTNKITEEDDSSSDEEGGDGDADDARMKGTKNQELTYEEPEDEEFEKSDSEENNENEENIITSEKNNDSENETNEESTVKKERKRINSNLKQDRINCVKAQSPIIDDYDFDDVKEEWCVLSLQFSLGQFKIDLASLIQEEAKKAVLYKVGKIDKAFLVKNPNVKDSEYENMIKTEGVSFLSLIKFSNYLDLNRVYSNDIHAIANTFGIEAGRKAIVQEMKNVFGVYGIEIDPRHLSLIADYMTFGGVIKGMNRFSINSNSSPIQQITFETSMQFLKNATLLGIKDEISSPSSRLFVGRPITAGSGILECLLDNDRNAKYIKQKKTISDPKTPVNKRKIFNIKSSQKKVKLDL